MGIAPIDTDNLAEINAFLRSFEDSEGEKKYIIFTARMIELQERSLPVDFSDLEVYDPSLAKELLTNPFRFIHDFEESVNTIVGETDPIYLQNNTIHVRFTNPPKRIMRALRKIRSSDIGKFIGLEAIVTKSTTIKPLLTRAFFRCMNCGNEMDRLQDEGRYNPPFTCTNETCGKKGPFKLLKEESSFEDWQKIIIQERPEELPAGQMPESFVIYLLDDLVDTARPGDRVLITGILDVRPTKRIQRGDLPTFINYIDSNSVKKEVEEYSKIEITEEDEKEILAIAKLPNIHDRIRNSIAPAIHGYNDIKEAIALLLFGGASKTIEDGTKLRGESNVLIIGDPGMGKSQILRYILNLAPRAIFTSGKGSSAAGLTAAVIRDPDTGEMSLEAGALVLADKGVALIDEFDKMRKEDRSALHEAMEQHSISIAKAGIVATLNARTSILAAANPRQGRWDPTRDLSYNINLPPTLISRFDLIFPLIDKPDLEDDRKKAIHILSLHKEGRLPIEPPITKELLRKYIAYARQKINPSLTEEARESLLNFYLQLREQSKELSEDGKTATIAITPRQLEALVRLSEARAKSAHRAKVLREDADAVIRLMESTMRKIAFDPETGTYDSDILATGRSSKTRNKLLIITEIIEELTGNSNDPIEIEDIISSAKKKNVKANEVEDAIDALLEDGYLLKPIEGKVRKV